MGVLKKILIGIVIVIGALYAWNKLSVHTNRFELVMEVETPAGLKSGTTVIETQVRNNKYGLPESRNVRGIAYGEAIFIDMGAGRNLVMLLGWGPTGEETDGIFGLKRAALAKDSPMKWEDEDKLSGEGLLPPKYIPTLATFDDPNNAFSGRVIDRRDLAREFGEGFSFHSIKLRTTNVEFKHDIAKQLPFLISQRRELFSLRSHPDRFAPRYILFVRDGL
jgi:hypothetical protein